MHSYCTKLGLISGTMLKSYIILIALATQALVCSSQSLVFRDIFWNSLQNRKANSFLLERAQYNLNYNLDSTLWYCNAVIFLSQGQELQASLGRAHSIKGELYQKKSDFQLSIANYLKAIDLGKQNNFLPILASAYNGLGITYYMMQDYEQAEVYIRKALDVKMKQKDYVYYAIIASNLAALLVFEGKNEEALKLLKKSENVVLQAKLPEYLPNIYNSIGAIYYQMKNAPDSALHYYQKSIALAETYKVQQNMVTGYHNLGHLQLEKKQFDSALQNLKIAEKLATSMKSAPLILRTAQTLGEIYEAMGKYDLALEYKKREQELSKEIFDSERQKSIEELQIQYETAEKDRINQEQKGKLLESELKAKKTTIRFYILIFSVILVLVLSLSMIYFYYQRRLTREKINQEKIRIFENVVHDIRTPLTLIHGPLQELKSKFKDKNEDAEYFTMIERNSEKLMRMVDELLDVSKIDKGKYQVAWTDGNLSEYLKRLLRDFDQEAKERQIEIRSEIQIPGEIYRFSKDVLEKVVFNLLSNSLKYAPANSTVEVKAKLEGGLMKLHVSDEGRGIAAKDQERIFERFVRLNEHRNLPGTGIGLAVVREFLELIGGSIHLRSELGKGAHFEVLFPVEQSQIVNPIEEQIESDRLQLLVCDDDIDILHFVKTILSSEYEIHTVNNGKEALEFVENNAPDAILSDVMMPELDGIGLLQQLKENPLWRSIPVVLFSAKAALESRLEGLKAGADYYIPKPFNPEELKLILRNITSKIDKNREDFVLHKALKKPFRERLRSENDYVNKALDFVIQNMDNSDYSVNELASDMCISRSQLHRKLTLFTGNSATQFIRMIRLEKAKDLLESNFGNVEEIAYACGFSSRSYFSSSFAEYFGKTPTEVLKGE